mgnify:CR=1 FL=1
MATLIYDNKLPVSYKISNPNNFPVVIENYSVPAGAIDFPIVLTETTKIELEGKGFTFKSGTFATAEQGAKADTALQEGAPISAIAGLQAALDSKADAGG